MDMGATFIDFAASVIEPNLRTTRPFEFVFNMGFDIFSPRIDLWSLIFFVNFYTPLLFYVFGVYDKAFENAN